jgi:hypothetical protein
MLRILLCFAALVLIALTSGCASLPQSCIPPSRAMVSADMIFGRNIGNRLGVSESAFASFVATEVTPRFPDGLTIVDGNGQWRDTRGSNVRERTKVMIVTFTDDAEKRAGLRAIADSYKKRFSQQSVLTQVRSVCVSF